MATVEQHRRLAVSGRQLQTPGRGLIGGFDFSNDAGERAVAQTILGKRQDFGILARLRVKHLIRPEPGLLKPRSVEIKPGHCPQNRLAWLGAKPCSDAGGKQRSRRIVVQRCRRRSKLVQALARNATVRQPVIEQRHAERQCGFSLGIRLRQLGAKRGEPSVAWRKRGGNRMHDKLNDSYVLFMFH